MARWIPSARSYVSQICCDTERFAPSFLLPVDSALLRYISFFPENKPSMHIVDVPLEIPTQASDLSTSLSSPCTQRSTSKCAAPYVKKNPAQLPRSVYPGPMTSISMTQSPLFKIEVSSRGCIGLGHQWPRRSLPIHTSIRKFLSTAHDRPIRQYIYAHRVYTSSSPGS